MYGQLPRFLSRTARALCWIALALAVPTMSVAVEMAGNSIYEVHVQEAAPDTTHLGSWNAVTGPLHPAGDDRDLLFRGTRTDTNFSTLRIYRPDGSTTDYTMGGRADGLDLDPHVVDDLPSPLGNGWRTIWQIDSEGLRVVQDVVVVGSTLDDSAVYHAVSVENLGASTARIGWRNLHDWALTVPSRTVDNPTNRLEAACGRSLGPATGDAFSHRPVSAGWVRMSLPGGQEDYEPLLALAFDPGLLPGLPVTVPDEYAYVHWRSAVSTTFDYTPNQVNLSDSAGLSWFGRTESSARSIPPGGSVRFTQALFAFEPSECPRVEACAPVPHGLVGWWPFDEPDQGVSGRFDDVARGHDGLARFAPTAIAGKVGRAARFDGDLDEVVVQDAPDLNFPPGVDLSIDFWIRTTDTSGLSIVLEKRTFDPGPRGYQVFLFNGMLGLQLADGDGSSSCSSDPNSSACTNYGSSGFVADGDWHLVAVTVDRDHPQGGRWYIDGAQVGAAFNPTVRSGSLANDAQLLIGSGERDSPFAGDLDELEIARRVLAPGEVRAIFEAGAGGKCSLSVDAPWDTALCEDDTSVLPQISVCNRSARESRFVFGFQGLPPMPAGVPHGNLCTAAGPTQFELLGNQPLVVPAGECRTAQVKISNPPSQTDGLASCYRVTATDAVSGRSQVDFGFIPATNRVCCRPADPVTAVGSGRPSVLTFELEDTGLGSPTLDVRVETMLADESIPTPLRFDGAPAGEPITRQVTFGADGRARLDVEVELTEDFTPLSFYDVVASTDLDADGEREFIGSATVLPTPDPCSEGLNELCLAQTRFTVDARWRTAQGTEGTAQAVPLTSDTGFFWFFRDSNLELVVKVLDACSFADRFWVFAGGLTNVEVELTVTDQLTGDSQTYMNPLNTPFQPIQDTDAFDTCDAAGSAAFTAGPDMAADVIADPTTEPAAQVTDLPLAGDRFLVEVEWQTNLGTQGSGQGVPITSDTGYFWFFQDTNVELVVKVLDACVFADRFWVFAGGLTNVDVTLTVTDTFTGLSKQYHNPQGTPFQPIQDTDAFATCAVR